MQQNLNVEMEVLQDAGHINADSGFGEWEWMLKKVQGEEI
ncbi:MAG: serine hydrolase family protein, partial [Epsilonproteobacteria bacterium]|nr:serine hydrolase family protein [Campylobacterota bacterium]